MRGHESEDRPGYSLRGSRRPRRAREASLPYVPGGVEPMPKTTISSKYQITLPARLVRELGLKPGDKLAVELEHGCLVLHPRPKDCVSYTAGALEGMYGKTKEDVDAYLRELRGSWGPLPDDEEEGSTTT